MSLPAYSAEDFASAFFGLMPTGPIWPRDTDTDNARTVAALMPTYERSWASATALIADAFPSTTEQLLPDWELSLGLPDPCAGPDPTIELRQLHVVARLTQSQGADVPGLIAYAAALGYPVTITEFGVSRFGRPFGQRFNGPAWASAWQVNAPTFTVDVFRFGAGHFGDPFRFWSNTVLQCEMQRLAPAHTTLLFSYS